MEHNHYKCSPLIEIAAEDVAPELLLRSLTSRSLGSTLGVDNSPPEDSSRSFSSSSAAVPDFTAEPGGFSLPSLCPFVRPESINALTGLPDLVTAPWAEINDIPFLAAGESRDLPFSEYRERSLRTILALSAAVGLSLAAGGASVPTMIA